MITEEQRHILMAPGPPAAGRGRRCASHKFVPNNANDLRRKYASDAAPITGGLTGFFTLPQ